MSIMSSRVFLDAPPAPAKPYKRNLLLRIGDTIVEAQRQRAEREVARVVARHGSQFSDSVERSVL
jgi:hypothetical protein